jgi:hypothetical protein
MQQLTFNVLAITVFNLSLTSHLIILVLLSLALIVFYEALVIAFYTLLAMLLIYVLLLLRRAWHRMKAKLRRESTLASPANPDS